MPATTATLTADRIAEKIAEAKRQLKNTKERRRKALAKGDTARAQAIDVEVLAISEQLEQLEDEADGGPAAPAPAGPRMSLDDPYEVRNSLNDILATAPTAQGAILARQTMQAEGEPNTPFEVCGPDGRPMTDKQLNAAVKAELSAAATKVIEDAVDSAVEEFKAEQAISAADLEAADAEAAERRASETRKVTKKVAQLPTGPDADRAIVAIRLLVDSTDEGGPRDVTVMNHLLELRTAHGWDFKQLAAIAALGGYEREYLWLHLINHAKREGKPAETRESLEAKIARTRARLAALEAELAALAG